MADTATTTTAAAPAAAPSTSAPVTTPAPSSAPDTSTSTAATSSSVDLDNDGSTFEPDSLEARMSAIVEDGEDARLPSVTPPPPPSATANAAPVVANTTPAVANTTPAASANTADPDWLKDLGPSHRADGRENRIPYSAAKRVVENAVKQAQETAAKEFQPKIQQYEAALDNVSAFENEMLTQPVQFLQRLAAKIPAYRELFMSPDAPAAVKAAMGGQQPPSARQPQVDPKNDPMPQPDWQFSDGNKTYSPEQLTKLMDWQARQVEAKFEAKFGQRLKPFEEERRAAAVHQQASAAVGNALKEAEAWPGFKENLAEIEKVMVDDMAQAQRTGRYQFPTLQAAYQHVVYPKLQADREKMRQELLAELRTAPTSTGVTAPSVPAPTNQSLEERMLSKLRADGRI